jgi:hypothetical protein
LAFLTLPANPGSQPVNSVAGKQSELAREKKSRNKERQMLPIPSTEQRSKCSSNSEAGFVCFVEEQALLGWFGCFEKKLAPLELVSRS